MHRRTCFDDYLFYTKSLILSESKFIELLKDNCIKSVRVVAKQSDIIETIFQMETTTQRLLFILSFSEYWQIRWHSENKSGMNYALSLVMFSKQISSHLSNAKLKIYYEKTIAIDNKYLIELY